MSKNCTLRSIFVLVLKSEGPFNRIVVANNAQRKSLCYPPLNCFVVIKEIEFIIKEPKTSSSLNIHDYRDDCTDFKRLLFVFTPLVQRKNTHVLFMPRLRSLSLSALQLLTRTASVSSHYPRQSCHSAHKAQCRFRWWAALVEKDCR